MEAPVEPSAASGGAIGDAGVDVADRTAEEVVEDADRGDPAVLFEAGDGGDADDDLGGGGVAVLDDADESGDSGAESDAADRVDETGGSGDTDPDDGLVGTGGDAVDGVDGTGGGGDTDPGEAAVLYDIDVGDDSDDIGGAERVDGLDDDGGRAVGDGDDADAADGVDDSGGNAGAVDDVADAGGDADGDDGGEVSGVRFVVDGFGGVLVEGPCGWTGPACSPAEGVAPIDTGGALRLFDESHHRWGPWVGRVFDMCDDHEALVVLKGEWAFVGHTSIGHDDGSINYLAPITPFDMERVLEEREGYSIVCSDAEAAIPDWRCWGDGSGSSKEKLRAYLAKFEEWPESSVVMAWAESVGLDCYDAAAQRSRYVYVTRRGPLSPKSTVEAAVEEFLERAAEVSGAPSGRVLGYSVPLGYRYPIESPVDSLVVLPATVSVIDGVLRGLAQNHSQRLWARNVAVMATDPNGGVGEWRFPLTVQPGELFPFEIENWAGTLAPADINFSVAADLSPTIDLTRALKFYVERNVDLEYFYYDDYDYPEAMGAFPDGRAAAFQPPDDDKIPLALSSGTMQADGFPDGYLEWVHVRIERSESTQHPWLAEAAREQTIENLTVYAAILEGGVIVDVFELTPMTWDASGEWVEMRTIPTQPPDLPYLAEYAHVGVVGHTYINLWAGGVAHEPRPPGDEPQ